MLRRKWFWWAVDVLFGLLLAMTGLIRLATFDQHPPAVTTYGQYAVTVTWPAVRDDDVDTYLRDPQGEIVWYGSLQVGALQLEHDDLAVGDSGYGKGQPNYERVVIRQSTAGEYVVNVHLYARRDSGPVPLLVQLWDLRGHDRVLLSRTLNLNDQGDEQTVFRFSLNRGGDLAGTNRLPVSLLTQAAA